MGTSILPNVPLVTRDEIVQLLIDETIWSTSFEATVANGSDLVLSFVTPAAPAIVAFEEITVNLQASADLDFLEAPTVSVAGNVLTPFNANRTSADSPSTVVRDSDTLTGGTILIANPLGAGSKNQATGASLTGDRGWILKVSTVYSFVINNTSGSGQDMGMIVRFLEV